MYKYYKNFKVYQIILFAMVALLVGLGLAAFVDVFRSGENIFVGIFGCIFFLGLAFVFFNISLSMSKPYSKIDALRASNPELVKDYEEDFLTAENIQNTIWFGQRYVFFHAFKFAVASYSEIEALRLYKHHTNKTSSFELEATVKGEKIQVNFSIYGKNKEVVVAVAERLSTMSGAPLSNELSKA
ncbi:MAG: hypothetical protein MJ108_02390 [Saccharofermentans sp.]|nr:hypothetical protein [Saccharofermentans sp.]